MLINLSIYSHSFILFSSITLLLNFVSFSKLHVHCRAQTSIFSLYKQLFFSSSQLISSNLQLKMYPKVKIRAEGQSDKHGNHDYKWSTLLSLKDVPLLLLQDSCFQVKDYRDISPPRIARVPKSYVPNIILPTSIYLPTESASKGSDKKNNSDEDRQNIRFNKKSISDEEDKPDSRSDKKSNSEEGDRPNIRASSVPRPRAVLSSPDNDAVIGNKNRVKALRPSVLKNHNVVGSRYLQSKTVGDQAFDDKSSPSLRKPKDTTHKKIDFRVNKGSATSTRSRSITPRKPSSVGI